MTWAYDLDTDTWEEMAPAVGPPRRTGHMMAYDHDSDRVILFGGITASDDALGDTWSYDFNNDSWAEMTPVSSPRPASTPPWPTIRPPIESSSSAA